jgi:hypothetical protein
MVAPALSRAVIVAARAVSADGMTQARKYPFATSAGVELPSG